MYRYAIERFLYRLSRSPHQEHFVLKGAQVFTAWGVQLGRPTRDIDLRGDNAHPMSRLIQIFREVCLQETEPDGMIFDPETLEAIEIQEEAVYRGVRILFWGELGSARVRMQIDLGFSDKITPTALFLEYPSLLNLPVPKLLSYPPESVMAEKLQALVYLGEINSRMKDYYDLLLLSERFDFEGEILQKAIKTTFHTRETIIPSDIPYGLMNEFANQKQTMWQIGFLGKFQRESTEWTDFPEVVKWLHTFLTPVLVASARELPFTFFWKAGDRWYEN